MSGSEAAPRRRLAIVLTLAAVVLVCAIVALTRTTGPGAAEFPVHLEELPAGCAPPPGATAFMCVQPELP